MNYGGYLKSTIEVLFCYKNKTYRGQVHTDVYYLSKLECYLEIFVIQECNRNFLKSSAYLYKF